jgi:hypothetical protein
MAEQALRPLSIIEAFTEANPPPPERAPEAPQPDDMPDMGEGPVPEIPADQVARFEAAAERFDQLADPRSPDAGDLLPGHAALFAVEVLPHLGNKLADVPRDERRAFDEYLQQSAERQLDSQPPPLEPVETRACRRMLLSGGNTLTNTAVTIWEIGPDGIDRFDQEMRLLFEAASSVMRGIYMQRGYSLDLPEYPKLRVGE